MKKDNKYAIIGLKALQRAAQKVADDARRNNYKIPVWINGRIVHKIPGMITEQSASVDARPSQAGVVDTTERYLPEICPGNN